MTTVFRWLQSLQAVNQVVAYVAGLGRCRGRKSENVPLAQPLSEGVYHGKTAPPPPCCGEAAIRHRLVVLMARFGEIAGRGDLEQTVNPGQLPIFYGEKIVIDCFAVNS